MPPPAAPSNMRLVWVAPGPLRARVPRMACGEELAARYMMPVSVVKKLPGEEFHDENEYIVDGGALDVVEIVRRYPSPQ